ncbi:MAG TPA: CDP-alcohol phosphatidyltransferase family protein [Solirubrobacteraceae bacterium]
MPQPRLSRLRLFGLDRSGPPPPQTAADAPLRLWTIPNAIGYARALLIPAILAFAYGSDDGTYAGVGICFFLAGAGDYADGIAARLTGQYSRMGALLDPVVDRLLVLAGLCVCWSFELLPRWLIAIVVVREVLMLLLGQAWVRRGMSLRINWPGRIAVGPTMFGIWLALLGVRDVAEGFVVAGITLAIIATGYYFRDGLRQIRVSSSA